MSTTQIPAQATPHYQRTTASAEQVPKS
jgi:hypothetical protein